MMFKLVGSSTIFAAVGNILIPFATDWPTYQKDFSGVPIIEINIKEFAKFTVAKFVEIKAK